MASILRQIVAGPRARHPDADLDLCYVTDNLIATSGPSATYPQRAYRNPLEKVVEFLDQRHGDNWAIWEFRAEGTGYPDDAVYGRVRHYPWPDHHPPPFRLVPMIMASMRNWLHGGDWEGPPSKGDGIGKHTTANGPSDKLRAERREKRVVVVHCKAGKGRSGTVTCSYLIAEEAWKPEAALARFTERRMRPRFGAGVSIPSQLRWVGYVDRWTRGSKRYRDRPIEIVEIHAWGLRSGVKVDVAGFADEGKRIEVLHTFRKKERIVVEGTPPDEERGGLTEMVWEMAGVSVDPRRKAPDEADMADSANAENDAAVRESKTEPVENKTSRRDTLKHKGTQLIRRAASSTSLKHGADSDRSKTVAADSSASSAKSTASNLGHLRPDTDSRPDPDEAEPGGRAVILRPEQPIRVSNCDVNVSVERRSKSHKSMGFTMVTAVAHVWFNTFFEGDGPEQDGKPDDSGVFAIAWDAMDGIKGSSRKGSRAFDKIAVVWRAAGAGSGSVDSATPTAAGGKDAGLGRQATFGGEEVDEPAEGQPVPQSSPADWKGGESEAEKDLGLRMQSPTSADVSKASSIRTIEAQLEEAAQKKQQRKQGEKRDYDNDGNGDDDDDDAASHKTMEGLRTSGPTGDELSGSGDGGGGEAQEETTMTGEDGSSRRENGQDLLDNPDTASGTTKPGGTEVV